MKISLIAEELFHIGPVPITNSLVVTWIVMIVLVAVSFLSTRKMKLVPTGLQNFMETIIEQLFNLFNSITQNEKLTKKIFPLVATIFLLVICVNWTEALPGLDSIGLKSKEQAVTYTNKIDTGLPSIVAIAHAQKNAQAQTNISQPNESNSINIEANQANENQESPAEASKEVEILPFLRSPSSDLNFTLALAIVAVLSIQIFGIAMVGAKKYAKKFINFSGPIQFGVGLLEIVSEFSRIISFSFRLFGNIFAGEVLLIVISFLIPYLVPIPFMGMELFVGFIQALIFSMLTTVFLTMAAQVHEE